MENIIGWIKRKVKSKKSEKLSEMSEKFVIHLIDVKNNF